MLTTYKFTDANPVVTPAATDMKLSKNDALLISSDVEYIHKVLYQNALMP